jgi:hypothetical protein
MRAHLSGGARVWAWLLAALALGGSAACAASVSARRGFYLPPACQTVTFHSEPALDAQRVCMNLGVRSHPATPDTYLFLTPHSSGAGIFKPNGTLVWWNPPPNGATRAEDVSVVTLWGRPYLAVWSGEGTSTGSLGEISLYNEHYQRVGLVTAGGRFGADEVDLHEFRVTPQGNALIGIWETVPRVINGRSLSVIQYVVQELSLVRGSAGIHSGRVIFQWDSLDHVPVSESHQPEPASGAWDYFHGNSVAQDTDGNLVVSGRNTWGIYEISVKTGRVIWQVGGIGDHKLKQPWCDQHDVTPLGADRYSVFDDGGSGAGCEPGKSGHASRAIIFRVIPPGSRSRITLVHSYTHTPPTNSEVFGSVQSLTGGDVLVDWGSTPEVTEYSPSADQPRLDLSLSAQSYRAFEFPWVGRPAAPPAVAAEPRLRGTEVWVSWNGSTQVEAWRVLGGPSSSQLAPVSRRLPKGGFETAISIPGRYPFVAVQALSSRGRVIGTSKAIQPGS